MGTININFEGENMVKETYLHDKHVALGAKMVDFRVGICLFNIHQL